MDDLRALEDWAGALLAKLDPKSGYRNYVQVKLEAIGGSAPAPTPVAGGAAAPASPANAVILLLKSNLS